MTFPISKRQETRKEYDRVKRTTCCNCPTGCGMKVFLRENKIVEIFGDEAHPVNKGSLCPKGLLAYWHQGNRQRLIFPQIRESLDDVFKRVSLDDAVAYTSDKLNKLKGRYGGESIFIYADDNMPFGYLAGGSLFAEYYGISNPPHSFFPFPFGEKGSIKTMFGIPGLSLLTNTVRDWCNSRCIVLYSCDIAVTDPVSFGHIADARDRGNAVVAIDSGNTMTASKASLSVKIKPGSGATVLKGITNLLIKNKLYEENFVEEHTSGFQSLRDELEPFTPARVREESWVKEADLRKAADLIGRSRPIQVIAADWNSRRCISDEEIMMCGALVGLRGSVGIPGGGLNLLNASPFCNYGMTGINKEGTRPVNNLNQVLLLEDILKSRDNVSAIIWCGNPSAGIRGGKGIKEALREIPLIVHLSSYPNETFNYSHVSFPAGSWLEYSGLITNNNTRSVQWHNKVVEPAGESLSPLDFWKRMAAFNGFSEFLPWTDSLGRVDPVRSADFFLAGNTLTRAASVEKIDPDKNPPGGLLWPCIGDEDLEFEHSRFVKGDIRGRNILFQKGRTYPGTDKRFPTESGKITLLNTDGRGRLDNEAVIPGYNREFPMILTVGALVDFVEEYGYFVSDRDVRSGRQIVRLHPRIANLLGIKNGENVTVENSRGRITAPVWLTVKVDHHQVWCPEGIDPYQPYFQFESFCSLFEAPANGRPYKSYTMVTIYKEGQDRDSATRSLFEFLNKPGLLSEAG